MNPGHFEIPNFKKVKTVPQPQAGNLDPAGMGLITEDEAGGYRIANSPSAS
jgi:hypothetical protein